MKYEEFFYDNSTKYFILKPQDEVARERKNEYLKNVGFYQPQNITSILSGRLNDEIIRISLANTLQIVFEVTENCNLDCMYCGYGELYSGKNSKREKKNMPLVYATNFIEYINELFNQNLNRSLNKNIAISFYGGEPLLNIDFIKCVVEYVNRIKNENFNPRFTMTTNALLLKKHIAFLVENNFNILISLDGDQSNNSYRAYPNGKDAFKEIKENIDYAFKNYSDYFKKNIEFNSVIHNRNSVSEAFNYIHKKYNKNTKLSELNATGVNEDKREEFWEKYKNITADLNQSEDYRFIRDTLFVETPAIESLSKFIHSYTNNVYKGYIDFFDNSSKKICLPTGTCVPFSRKVFITSKGGILPCERISDEFSTMGHVTEEGVVIDYERIVNHLNSVYDKLLNNYCNQCFYATKCIQCLFNLNLKQDKLICHGYKHVSKSTQIISNHLSVLNNERKYYKKILKEVYYV